MKRFTILIFTIILSHFGFAQSDFMVRQQDNTYYIKHKVKIGESFYQLARDYSLKSAVLEKFNNVEYQKGLQAGQLLDIPLTETNFFKMAGLSTAKGFVPVYYQATGNESKEGIEKRFLVPDASFIQWNPYANATVSKGEKMIIGWLKYNNATNYVTAKSKPEEKVESVKEEIVANETENENEEVAVAEVKSEVKTTVKNTEILNPRYIDPNAPVKPRAVTSNYRRYTPNTPVKKEVQSINDDSKDFWAKTKAFFKGGKNKTKKDVATKEEVAIESKSVMPAKVEKTYTPTRYNSKPVQASAPKKEVVENDNSTIAIPNKYKNYDVAKKEKSKSKNVWSDFKNSFKVKDKEPKNVTSTIAAPKAVKGDPNRNFRDGKQESKMKIVWNDFKNSFKKDKKETENKYTAKQEAKRAKPVATTKVVKPLPIYNKPTSNYSKPKPKEIVKENITIKETKKEVVARVETPKKEIKNNVLKNTKAIPKVEVVTPSKEEVVIEKKIEDNVVKNDIKHLSLNNTQSGRASYFFSGPSGGKFYVATNLASKGEIIKIVNPENGKYVMAEVLSSLPSSDVSKGILLKLSDNAKMPLGQKNSSFNVKVNY